MRNPRRSALAVCAVVSVGCACLSPLGCSRDSSSQSSGNSVQERPEQIPLWGAGGLLSQANGRFSFKLFAEMVSEEVDENLVVSPPSVTLALCMALNGARGATRRAIIEALELLELNLDDINRANARLMTSLAQASSKVEISIANSLWMREGVSFSSGFLKVNESYYGAEVSTLDFAKPSAPDIINRWVGQATQGRITRIVDKIKPAEILYLINAIYFKGIWGVTFDEAETTERPFTFLDGSRRFHPMMHRQGTFEYLQAEDFQAVSLPYGRRDGRIRMYVFLPSLTSGLGEFVAALSPSMWNGWMSQFRNDSGDLWLPRFKVECGLALDEPLKTLGMDMVFDSARADFSGIFAAGDGSAWISRIDHKTFIDVNEEGTTAAAVTSIPLEAESVRPSFRMVVNRPFFFAILDEVTGVILFMGAIVEPM